MPGAAFTEKLQRREHAFFLHSWISINNDPFYHVYWVLRSECCNYARYEHPHVWDLIDDHMLITDAAAGEQGATDSERITNERAAWA